MGGLTEEVHVDVDEHRLATLGIPISRIADIVGSENINAAGGRLRDRDSEYMVRTVNQFSGSEDIGQTVVQRDRDRVVKLADVATVTRSYKEREIISRLGGVAAVEIAVYKEGDANIVETASLVRGRLADLEKTLPNEVKLSVLADQSTFIQAAIRPGSLSSAVIGGGLAILILLIFLRDVPRTFPIILANPISIVTTFVLMYRQGITLNVMSMGGLALGVGMLVDNSIVVLESIVRHRRMGTKSEANAVIDGTNEVGQAITASTLTTIAVFLPILFVEGIARQIFKDQALTVTYSLLVSLVVALTLTPMVTVLMAKLKRRIWNPLSWAPSQDRLDRGDNGGVQPALEETGRVFGGIRNAYIRLLTGALHRRAVVVLTAVALFSVSILGIGGLGMDLIPSFSQGEFRFDLEFPQATPIEQTNLMTNRLEKALIPIPNIKTVFTNIGLDAGASGSGGLRSKKENHAELTIQLKPDVTREETAIALETIRRKLAAFPEIDGTLKKATAFTFKTPVEVEIYGYEIDELTEVSNQVVETLKTIPGLKDIATNMETGNPEVQIRFDRDKLKLAGLELRNTSDALRTNILGRVATDFKDRNRQIDVRVRSENAQDLTFADLNTMVVGYHQEIPVQLASVANVSMNRGPARIQRISQTRAAVVSANLQGRDLGGVAEEIQFALAGLPIPPNVTMEVAGQNEEMQNSMRSLIFAGLLAIFLVYLVMASQFESLLNPFLILFAVPMALIGVVAGLWVTGTAVSVVVLIGGIMLAGIVVNNGIVLVDLIGQLRREGRSAYDAVIEAGAIRLRPILMTTITTILALIPLAIGSGQGAEIMAPLAVTVIGGLLVSTLLTLVLIPVLYSLVHQRA